MHPSPRFRETSPATLLARMTAHTLALVSVNGETAPLVSHTPVLVRQEGDGTLLGFHLSAANPVTARLLAGTALEGLPGEAGIAGAMRGLEGA